MDEKKVRMPDFLIRRKIRSRSKTLVVLIGVVATMIVNIYIAVTLYNNSAFIKP